MFVLYHEIEQALGVDLHHRVVGRGQTISSSSHLQIIGDFCETCGEGEDSINLTVATFKDKLCLF